MIYPDLPIVAQRQAIIEAIRQYPVIIVAGETGSGKTTQLPKMCLEAGLGQNGLMIGHTQPRRLAARTIAMRIASEMQCALGQQVGYQIRFSDKTSQDTQIKLMTDGILLQETQQDPLLKRYDCIIIDEAHERSLNIDFLLAYLKRLRAKRPDLKIIVTSATIDIKRFVSYFDEAPLIEISGRTYPVTVHYADVLETDYDDPMVKTVSAVKRAIAEGKGDILIFQSGEKEIRETIEALEECRLPHTTLLPLYARLPVSEQQKIFQSYSGRKIIVSTNVAETSLTVPNIRFVIDTGFARINRYHYRSRVQRLMIEPISRSSAEQRKGRCGRVGPGICYRLYTEEDLMSRDEFTTPEILRTHLAGVILKLLDLGVKDIGRFPFMDPPEYRHIKDGLTLLHRLGAIDFHHRITPVGRLINQIPMEPKLARTLIEANRLGALQELLIITSFLSIVDPRERPPDQQAKADEQHAKYQVPGSDFMAIIALWDFVQSQKSTLSQTQFRKCCRTNFLSFMRLCEWMDVYEQLCIKTQELGFKRNSSPAASESLHQALLVGLLDTIGQKVEKREYAGIRNTIFYVHPASKLAEKPPQWIMSFEIIQTSKMYARMNAKIEPEWIETVAKPFLKVHYFEPTFDAATGRIVAYARMALFGLEIVSKRRVSYEKINPRESRELFIRQGLVEGRLQTDLPFFAHNQAVIASLHELESRLRRDQVLITDEWLQAFYEGVIPSTVVSHQTLQQWIREESPASIYLSVDQICPSSEIAKIKAQYPDEWIIQQQAFTCTYRFDWENPYDGVTLHIPLPLLAIAKKGDFSWPIPGHLTEKIFHYLKALPKPYRMMLPPLGEVAEWARAALEPRPPERFDVALARLLRQRLAREIPVTLWDNSALPADLKWHFCIEAPDKSQFLGDDLLVVADQALQAFPSVSAQAHAHSTGHSRWDFDDLPEERVTQRAGYAVTEYPALIDQKTHVSVGGFDEEALAHQQHRQGLARLYLCAIPDALKQFHRNINPAHKKWLKQQSAVLGDPQVIFDEILMKAADAVFMSTGALVRSRSAFEAVLTRQRTVFLKQTQQLLQWVLAILADRLVIERALAEAKYPQVSDLKKQLTALFSSHWILTTPITIFPRYLIYLKAMQLRLKALPSQAKRDQQAMVDIDLVQKAYQRKIAKLNAAGKHLDPEDPLVLFRWKIEELRVSLFAQTLGTPETVSRIRLLKVLDNIG